VDPTHSGSTHAAAVDTHIADTEDAHDASAISILDTANDFTATDVEGALAELQSDAEAHLADTTDVHDHGSLSGLLDDDHPQYLTEAEGDAVYADITEPIAVAHRDDTTDVHDHGQLAGLADDDHTQYVKHSIADAVGDILVASGDNVFTRLAKGTQGQVLTVDTGEALDLKYADAAGGGGPSIFVWSSKVHLTNGSASRRIYVAEDMTISYCYVSLGTANTGSCIVDVHKNGTTIYTTQANRPTVTAAFVSDHEVPDVTALAAGAYLECIIDQVGAGTQGRVQVYIVATYD